MQCSVAVTYGANIPIVTNYTVNVSGQPFFIDDCPLKNSPFSVQILNNTQYYISIASSNAVGSSHNVYRMISMFLFANVCLLLFYMHFIGNLISTISETEHRGRAFIALRITVMWNNSCNNSLQVEVSYIKLGSCNTQRIEINYSIVDNTEGKLVYIENLDPASEYAYNISVYDGNGFVMTEINKSFYTSDNISM